MLLQLVAFGLVVQAQDMQRVRSTIDVLCAPAMHGRGYVKQGEKKAAKYLSEQFASIGLRPLGNSYFQPFTLDINVFPNALTLKIDGKTLTPGREYLLNAISEKGSGKGEILRLDTSIFTNEQAKERFLQTDLSSKVMVYEKKDYAQLVELPLEYLTKLYDAKAVIELQNSNKLTASLSGKQLSHPFFEVKKQDFDPRAKQVQFKAGVKLMKDYPTQNVIGFVKGSAQPDSFIVITAHYDHLGRMGKKVYFPGANDNASGVSMLLELAHYFASHPPKYSIAFIAFGAEEAGLIGSKYYAEHPLFPLRQIRFLLNLDLLGTGNEGIMVENGVELTKEFELISTVNARAKYFPALSKRANAPNSDHFFFVVKGVKSFFFYTLGTPAGYMKAYHDIDDQPANLPLTKYPQVFGLLKDFTEALMQ